MRQNLQFLLLFAPMLLLGSSSSLLAQHRGLHEQHALQAGNRTAPVSASKTASHEEYPGLETSYQWDEFASAWDTSSQTTNTYFPNGGLNMGLGSYYSNGTFLPSWRTTYGQDANGRDTSFLYEYHNGTIWQNSSRSTFTYDANGNQTSSWYYNWNGTSWDVNSAYRQTYTFVNGNNISVVIEEAYDPALQTWTNDYKAEFTYNVQNQWESQTFYVWDMNSWLGEEKIKDIIWHNFSKEQPLSATIQSFSTQWDDYQRLNVAYTGGNEAWLYEAKSGASWLNYSRSNYHYDSNEHLTFSKEETWDSTNIWVVSYVDSTQYLYNGFGQTIEIINLDYDSTGYHNFFRNVYGNYFTGANPVQTLELAMSVYPNPAAEALHFKMSLAKPSQVSIILYDLQGRKRVETAAFANGQEIVVPIASSLEAGTYIYRVQTKEGQAEGKVLIAR